MSEGEKQSERAAYAEASSNFRILTDIRFKLLAFLPVGTGGAILSGAAAKHGEFAVFGVVVTLGLWVYDQRNNQHYDELVGQAAKLEREMGLTDGPFISRPRPWLSVGGLQIEHRWPVELIYGACFASFLAVALVHSRDAYSPRRPSDAAIWLFCGALTACASWFFARWQDVQRRRLRDQVRKAWRALSESAPRDRNDYLTSLSELVQPCCSPEVNVEAELDRARTKYATVAGPLAKEQAAQLLAGITDLPSRWILRLEAPERKLPARSLRLGLWVALTVLAAVAAWQPRSVEESKSTSGRDMETDQGVAGAVLVQHATVDVRDATFGLPVASAAAPCSGSGPGPNPSATVSVPSLTPAEVVNVERARDSVEQSMGQHGAKTGAWLSTLYIFAGTSSIVAGFFMVSRNKVAAGALATIGTLSLGAGALADIAKDAEFTLFKIDVGKLIGELHFSPRPTPAKIELRYEEFREVGPFKDGEDIPTDALGMDRALEARLPRGCAPYAFLIVFGRADIRELTTEKSRAFVTNRRLAESRANYVSRRLAELMPSCGPSQVITIPSGPYDLGAGGDANRLAQDRQVQLLGIARNGG